MPYPPRNPRLVRSSPDPSPRSLPRRRGSAAHHWSTSDPSVGALLGLVRAFTVIVLVERRNPRIDRLADLAYYDAPSLAMSRLSTQGLYLMFGKQRDFERSGGVVALVEPLTTKEENFHRRSLGERPRVRRAQREPAQQHPLESVYRQRPNRAPGSAWVSSRTSLGLPCRTADAPNPHRDFGLRRSARPTCGGPAPPSALCSAAARPRGNWDSGAMNWMRPTNIRWHQPSRLAAARCGLRSLATTYRRR